MEIHVIDGGSLAFKKIWTVSVRVQMHVERETDRGKEAKSCIERRINS
jgi:hypothetical protein